MNRFNAAEKSPSELVPALSLISNMVRYERVGYDARLMVLLADGSVGYGAALCEAVWDVSDATGRLLLSIGSDTTLICQLDADDRGAWLGRWLVEEKMPIALGLIKAPAIACTCMDPEVQFTYSPNERSDWLRRRYAYPHLLRYRAVAQQVGLTSLLDDTRMHQLLTLLLYSLTLPGDTIECGVYRGGTSAFIAHAASKVKRMHYACDSFAGLPDTVSSWVQGAFVKGMLSISNPPTIYWKYGANPT